MKAVCEVVGSLLILWVVLFLLTFVGQWAHSLESEAHRFFEGPEVVKVYDGDTITVNIPDVHPLLGKGLSIRISGIDTPEIRGKCDKEKELAKRARAVSKAFVESGDIRLVHCQRGKYFRLACQVFVHGIDVGELLIQQGLARRYDGNGPRKGWCK